MSQVVTSEHLDSLKEQFRESGLTVAEMSRLAKISRNSVNAILAGTLVKATTAKKFEAVLSFQSIAPKGTQGSSPSMSRSLEGLLEAAPSSRSTRPAVSLEDLAVVLEPAAEELFVKTVEFSKAMTTTEKLTEESQIVLLLDTLERLEGEISRIKARAAKLLD